MTDPSDEHSDPPMKTPIAPGPSHLSIRLPGPHRLKKLRQPRIRKPSRPSPAPNTHYSPHVVGAGGDCPQLCPVPLLSQKAFRPRPVHWVDPLIQQTPHRFPDHRSALFPRTWRWIHRQLGLKTRAVRTFLVLGSLVNVRDAHYSSPLSFPTIPFA